MVGDSDLKISTVEVESVDNMATLPVSRTHDSTVERNNTTNKEMELKNVQPKPHKRTSLFIIMSLIYAKILIVVCIAYVISDVVTHNIPLYYYEGFFTYLYSVSILFLLYVFCFLLQESSCCSDGSDKPKKKTKEAKVKPPKEDKKKKEKEEKEKDKDKKSKDKKSKDKKEEKKKEKDKSSKSKKSQPQHVQHDIIDVETGIVPCSNRRRKTTQSDGNYGSFFLRIGAIGFGLGTMIYNGLEFGTFFEYPFNSPCYHVLRGANPVLQMVFTFMQMYFIFMNSRLNIHRFKVIARFGLMHIFATNICVWFRTLVFEYMKEITTYHLKHPELRHQDPFAENIRLHTLRAAGRTLGTETGVRNSFSYYFNNGTTFGQTTTQKSYNLFRNFAQYAAQAVSTTSASKIFDFPTPPTTSKYYGIFLDGGHNNSNGRSAIPPCFYHLIENVAEIVSGNKYLYTTPKIVKKSNLLPLIESTTVSSTILPTTTPSTTTTTTTTTLAPTTVATTQAATFLPSPTTTQLPTTTINNDWFPTVQSTINNIYNTFVNPEQAFENASQQFQQAEELPPIAAALTSFNNSYNATLHGVGTNNESVSCERVNIMGNIVQDSAPYLFPFIIEYSLIGAAVIYVMWKHIGYNPRYITEEDLEHRLEVMLSRRAVAMAHAQQGRVDCVGASKGLFFGLLLLVASLICLILFFVLIHHPHLGILAIYLSDVSHCALMVFSIFAIIIGFIRSTKLRSIYYYRVQHLKFRTEEQNNLNDILLRISAFGLFIYAVFSVIAGAVKCLTDEPSLLVTITGALSIFQVVLQLLFIADVSRRRVYLPEHDRSKPGRQIVTFLLICNVTMWIIYTFEMQKVEANPIQLKFYGFLTWSLIQRITLPLCIFHRFHSAVTLAEIWKTSYKARLE